MTDTRRDTWWLVALLVGFVAIGLRFALYLVSWDAEWGYVFLGYLAVKGDIGLFQDEMLGERLPLPFYVMGISQVVAGRSLFGGRLWSLALAVLMVGLLFALGRSVGGPACGFLAALFVTTNGMLVGYYATASYFAFCALLIVAGLLAIAAVHRPWGPLLGMLCFSALALSRAHLAVMAPVVLAYLLVGCRGWRERVTLVLAASLPPLVFFAWSPEHLKILAYVPLVSGWVEPLGYKSLFALGGHSLTADRHWPDHLVLFGKRYVFWIVVTGAVAAGWIISRAAATEIRRVRPPGMILFAAGLAVYTLAWQALILRRFPESVAGWATTFAPLWALVVGYGASVLMRANMALPSVRIGVAAVLLAVFAVSPMRSRHPSMPLRPPPVTTPAALARESAVIRALVPPGARVFLIGDPMAAYLAGVAPYLRQITHPWTLVPSEDGYAVSRSGVWGPHEVETWLARDASYAIIAPGVLSGWYGTVDAYRPLAGRIESLLDRHFTLVAARGESPAGGAYLIYRRKSPAGGA